MEKATFAAGCFWGIEAAFQRIPGVVETAVGYEGGHLDNPRYEDVCTDETGHAEVVQIEFDPAKANYDELLNVFWSIHDPTTLNRQGPDTGTQYRSAIFYHNEAQRQIAEASKAEAQTRFQRPIVTEIVPASTFWRAEDYHQKYLEKRGRFACGH
jgi:peptide-methionine (S)-S-oxide reductase